MELWVSRLRWYSRSLGSRSDEPLEMGVGRVVAFGVLYTLAALLGDQKTKGLVYSAMSWQRTSSGVTKGGAA